MFKKISILCFTLIFIFSTSIYALDVDEDSEDVDVNSIIETSTTAPTLPQVNSVAAVVIERSTNTILFSKQSDKRRKMASTTKIMTATIVLENCKLDEMVKISPKAASIGGSRLGLVPNIELSVKDLLYGLLLCSGNDAAYALAEHVGGSVENFATFMNNKAKELGLTNTSFVTPHGLDSDNHYTTAYELALLTNYALRNDTFKSIVSTSAYSLKIGNNYKSIRNTNELLGVFSGVYGVKTGFTNGANRCLVTAAKRDGLDVICVVLGADTKKIRTSDSVNLLNYAFSNYEMVNVKERLDEYFSKNITNSTFRIDKAISSKLDLSYINLKFDLYPIDKSKKDKIDFSYSLSTPFKSPIPSNSQVGSINILVDNEPITNLPIINLRSINRKNINYYFSDFITNYFSYITQN